MQSKNILLSHGSGGRLMHGLIRDLLVEKLANPVLKELGDSAFIDYETPLYFTTDSFVVNPLFFSGGDIGKLSVCGTVNDLVVQGAYPEYLSLSLIIEEGLSLSILERIIDSISRQARKAKVRVATGDLKVVEKNACDKIFINTSGIGRAVKGARLSPKRIIPGDKIIISGAIAEHGLAVLAQRGALDFGFNIKSDCTSLNDLILPVLRKNQAIRFMRDPTRGGVATTLNEISQVCGYDLIIKEEKIPLSSKVKSACELLGMDPLYIANEGKAVIITGRDTASKVLGLLRKHPLGKKAEVIGEVSGRKNKQVILHTLIGTERIVDMLTGEPLPRIC
jgi:hydrogenase expression/formation protein HypE